MRDLTNLNDFGLSPFGMLDNIEKELKKFRADSLGGEFSPRCDIQDKDSHYLLSFDLPGIPKDEIEVEVANGQLRVSGERRSEKKEGDYSEKSYGSFERVMSLPENTDEESIEANYENGVLSIAVPKSASEEKGSKKISVKEGEHGGVWSKLLPHGKKRKEAPGKGGSKAA